MRSWVHPFLAMLLAGCAAQQPMTPDKVNELILGQVTTGTPTVQAQVPAIQDLLLPPLKGEFPAAAAAIVEPRFDLVVNNAPAQQVFVSIVSGTRYSMVVNPRVSGNISVTLKDVTVQEALDSIREVFGYEYSREGTRIYVQPASIQTKIFNVNYMVGLRTGRSDVRVGSGGLAATGVGSSTVGGGTVGATAPIPAAAGPGAGGLAPQTSINYNPTGMGMLGGSSDASRVATVSQSDFWNELLTTLRQIIGTGDGRNVIVNPAANIVILRAMPSEMRSAETYLKAMRLAVERQVMLEAKIIDVTLNEASQAGINWAAFPTRGISVGMLGSNATIAAPRGALTGGSLQGVTPGSGSIGTTGTVGSTVAGAVTGGIQAIGGGAGSIFGLALQTTNFAALMQFLETQGTVQVLSSPRVSTMNNQKAVLKVGTDEYFVTNVTVTPLTTATGVNGVNLTPTFSSFFSGVSLDVTPQIDDDGNITLHVHPLVSDVTNKPQSFNFGTTIGIANIPLASSSINETDAVVRVRDGNIVALGGLMKYGFTNDRSGVPGAQDMPGIGGLFRNTARVATKRELVLLIKPTIIMGDRTGDQDIQQTRERIQALGGGATPAATGGQ